jgi:hypothetical protein
MRQRLQRFFASLIRWLQPKPDQTRTVEYLSSELAAFQRQERKKLSAAYEFVQEMREAREMSGSGPWTIGPQVARQTDALIAESIKRLSVRESDVSSANFADMDLILQNVEWRRETQLSWLEFSRWGIQQIILVSRLYYVKNPIVRRLVDVCAAYVFARGVEISSTDDAANDVLKDFFERNRATLGQGALMDHERRKDYDGNLFFCLFSDRVDKGLVDARVMDATEIQEIITDPEDSDTTWFFKRVWTQRNFNPLTGAVATVDKCAWYPALGYSPEVKQDVIGSNPVMWDFPVYHRRCGAVAKWKFGCPRIYPMLDWAKSARKYLEACLTVGMSHAQMAWDISTKGGQQAMEGIKQQLGTTVGTNAESLWDTNPTPNNASTWVSGPGTKLNAINTRGANGNPEEVRQYKLMCCMVKGVPETFLGDVSTGNLATATSLDRPTETVFLELQEAWVEDLEVIAKYALWVSALAVNGKLRESLQGKDVVIREGAKKRDGQGRLVYENTKPPAGVIEVKVNFPNIREGDVPALVKATIDAMTLDNRGGQVVGIDEKAAVIKLYDLLGFEKGDELAEEQYPKGTYDPDRTKAPLPAPILKAEPDPGGQPQDPGGKDPAPPVKESMRGELKRLTEAVLELAKK